MNVVLDKDPVRIAWKLNPNAAPFTPNASEAIVPGIVALSVTSSSSQVYQENLDALLLKKIEVAQFDPLVRSNLTLFHAKQIDKFVNEKLPNWTKELGTDNKKRIYIEKNSVPDLPCAIHVGYEDLPNRELKRVNGNLILRVCVLTDCVIKKQSRSEIRVAVDWVSGEHLVKQTFRSVKNENTQQRFERTFNCMSILLDCEGIAKSGFMQNRVIKDEGMEYSFFRTRYKGDVITFVKNHKKCFLNETISRIHNLVVSLVTLREKKIVHCDIKPENAVCDESGTLSLIDFELSKTFEEYLNDISRKDVTVGTLEYVSPEVLEFFLTSSNALEISSNPYARDVWSCGVLALVLFINTYPHSDFIDVYDKFLKERIRIGNQLKICIKNNTAQSHTDLTNCLKTDAFTDSIFVEFEQKIAQVESADKMVAVKAILQIIRNMLRADHAKRISPYEAKRQIEEQQQNFCT